MAKSQDITDQFLRDLSFFAGLPEAAIGALRERATIKEYAKGKALFWQDDKANRFFIILQGWIKLYRSTPDGEEAIASILTRNNVFGESAIFDGGRYSCSAEAIADTKVMEIPAVILNEVIKGDAGVMHRVMSAMSLEVQKLQSENEHKVLMDAPQRVGCLLLRLSSNMIGKGGTFSFPYDKALAAQYLGMSPETFSRALSQLKSRGVVVKGSEISIDSFSTLAKYSCVHCSAAEEECGVRLRGDLAKVDSCLKDKKKEA